MHRAYSKCLKIPCVPKGQLISECPLMSQIFQKTNEKFDKFLSKESKKWSNHNIKALYIVFNTLNSPYDYNIRNCLYFVDLITFWFLGQKFVKFFVGCLENLKKSKRHSEIN